MNRAVRNFSICLLAFSSLTTNATEAVVTSIVFTPEKAGQFNKGHGICRGSVSLSLIGQIGLGPDDLQHGVRCISGDFDGNGEADYALFGAPVREPPVVEHPEGLAFVLMQEGLAVDMKIVKHARITFPQLYVNKDEVGEFGEPVSLTDGIIEPGEGGNTVIILYDQTLREFVAKEYASSNC